MPEPPWITWRDSLYSLRSLSGVPAALANATTLLAAMSRWGQHLVARTSMHDLLFTLPGDDYPFSSQVRVKWATGASTILQWQGDLLVEELIDALMMSDLGQQATDVHVQRRGPGMVDAKFDEDAFLITVRTEPPSR
jgi:hypothetical protein